MKALRPELRDEAIHARSVACGTIEARDEPHLYGIPPASEYDRNSRGCSFRGQRRSRIVGDEHRDLPANQIRGQSWQQVLAAIRETQFDRRVLINDVARLR